MRNTLDKKNLSERPAARAIVALSLTASLAAFGCTTNRTPGNGDPYRSGPGVGPTAAPTSSVPGTSSGTAVPDQPMMSSSTHVGTLPTVNAPAKRLPLSPDEAAAVMADHTTLNRGVKVLGTVNPGPSQSQGIALNASTTLRAGSAVTGVAVGGAAGQIVDSNDVSGVATVANSTIAGTTIATPTAATGGVIATPTNAGLPISAGAFAAGPGVTALSPTGVITSTNTATTPTAVSGAVPTPTPTSGTVVVNPGSAPTVSRTTTTPTTTTSATAPRAAATVGPTRTVISNANGRVTASNGKPR